jgi:hypothetical protein
MDPLTQLLLATAVLGVLKLAATQLRAPARHQMTLVHDGSPDRRSAAWPDRGFGVSRIS